MTTFGEYFKLSCINDKMLKLFSIIFIHTIHSRLRSIRPNGSDYSRNIAANHACTDTYFLIILV